MQRLSLSQQHRLANLFLTSRSLGSKNLVFRLFLDIDHTLLSTQAIKTPLHNNTRFRDASIEKLRNLCVKCEDYREQAQQSLTELDKFWPEWIPSAYCDEWGDAGDTVTCQLLPDEDFPQFHLPFFKEEVRTADGRITHWVVLWGYIWSDELEQYPQQVYMMATVVPADICNLMYIQYTLPREMDSLRCGEDDVAEGVVPGHTRVELRLASCGGPRYVRCIHNMLKGMVGDIFAEARSFPSPTNEQPSPKSIEAFELSSNASNTNYINIVADDQAGWWPEAVRNHVTTDHGVTEQLVPAMYYGADCTPDALVRLLDAILAQVGAAACKSLQQQLQQSLQKQQQLQQELEDSRRSSASSGSEYDMPGDVEIPTPCESTSPDTGSGRKRKATCGGLSDAGTPVKAATTDTARSPLKAHIIQTRALNLETGQAAAGPGVAAEPPLAAAATALAAAGPTILPLVGNDLQAAVAAAQALAAAAATAAAAMSAPQQQAGEMAATAAAAAQMAHGAAALAAAVAAASTQLPPTVLQAAAEAAAAAAPPEPQGLACAGTAGAVGGCQETLSAGGGKDIYELLPEAAAGSNDVDSIAGQPAAEQPTQEADPTCC